VLPKTLRLFLRRPSNVPDSLFGIWRVVWIVILAIRPDSSMDSRRPTGRDATN
jgi:hypothetical protein